MATPFHGTQPGMEPRVFFLTGSGHRARPPPAAKFIPPPFFSSVLSLFVLGGVGPAKDELAEGPVYYAYQHEEAGPGPEPLVLRLPLRQPPLPHVDDEERAGQRGQDEDARGHHPPGQEEVQPPLEGERRGSLRLRRGTRTGKVAAVDQEVAQVGEGGAEDEQVPEAKLRAALAAERVQREGLQGAGALGGRLPGFLGGGHPGGAVAGGRRLSPDRRGGASGGGGGFALFSHFFFHTLAFPEYFLKIILLVEKGLRLFFLRTH